MANKVLIGLRICQLVRVRITLLLYFRFIICLCIGQISLIIALGTVAAGATKCFWVGDQKMCECWKAIDVGQWPTYDANANSRMGGQYFVLVVCIVFFVVSVALLIIECLRKNFSKLLVC